MSDTRPREPATTDRAHRLEAARRVDWRFLLDQPKLDRVACVVPGDALLPPALAELGIDVATGGVHELAATGRRWQVVVLDGRRRESRDPLLTAAALELVEPGGWLLIDAPRRASLTRDLARAERALRSSGIESIRRHWHLPSREAATRVVLLDDPVAVRTALGRHASTRMRRIQSVMARAIAARAPADLVAGDVTLLVRRAGGPSIGSWPALGPLGLELAAASGLDRPSFVLLTPRFRASAHVILLVIGDDGRTRMVAKVARLPEDGGRLELEAEHLTALATSTIAPGSVPGVLALARVGGHAVLVESAIEGHPLDRAMVRRDPARWIRATSAWLEGMPIHGPDAARTFKPLVVDPLDRIGGLVIRDGSGPAALVSRARALLDPLRLRPVPLVFEHGDLSHPNIVARDADRLGVLDWETARPDGMPLHDLCFFLGYVALSTAGAGEPAFDGFMRVLAHRDWGAAHALKEEADRLKIDAQLLPALVLSCWIRSFAAVVDRLEISSKADAMPGWIGTDRYYALLEGAVRHHEQVAELLS